MNAALLMRGNFGSSVRIGLDAPAGRKQTMRWKISHHDHDPRLNDLLAILALAHPHCRGVALFRHALRTAKHAAFIVPSQSVRW